MGMVPLKGICLGVDKMQRCVYDALNTGKSTELQLAG